MKDKYLFLSSTHGSEGFSVNALRNLEKKFPKEEYGYDWIVANEQALSKNIRFIDKDLNRVAPGDINSNFYEERRAAEIVELSKNYKYIIDLHGTKSDFGIVGVIPFPTWENLLLASIFPVDRMVIWYAKSSIDKGPLVQHVKCPAIELECGPKEEDRTIKELEDVLTTFIKQKNMVDISDILSKAEKKEFFVVYDKMESTNKQVEFEDFKEVNIDGETFYSFMGKKEYDKINCYKMKKIDIKDLFLY